MDIDETIRSALDWVTFHKSMFMICLLSLFLFLFVIDCIIDYCDSHGYDIDDIIAFIIGVFYFIGVVIWGIVKLFFNAIWKTIELFFGFVCSLFKGIHDKTRHHSVFYKSMKKITKYSRNAFYEVEDDMYTYDMTSPCLSERVKKIKIEKILKNDVKISCHSLLFIDIKSKLFDYKEYLKEKGLMLDAENERKIVQLEELMKDLVNNLEEFVKNNENAFDNYLGKKEKLTESQDNVIKKMKERLDEIIYKFVLVMNTAKLKDENSKENEKMVESFEKTEDVLKDI